MMLTPNWKRYDDPKAEVAQAQQAAVGGHSFLILAPFAAGYFLSYLFRTANGSIADRLALEFGLGTGGVGLLTSMFFLAFAAFQIPAGLLIDRYGPRLVQGCLLPVAAVGAVVFAAARDPATLMLGRALLGLGCAGAFVTGMKAVVLWLPASQRVLGNSALVVCGGLGAMASTVPLDLMVDRSDWRTVFLGLAVAVAAVTAVVWLCVPPLPSSAAPLPRHLRTGLREIVYDAGFWQVAPLSASIVGAAFAFHGLWATRWLNDVAHFTPSDRSGVLLAMGASLTAAAVLLGGLATLLRRWHVGTPTLFGVASGVFMVLEAVVACGGPLPPSVSMCGFGAFGAMTVLSFTLMGELFPPSMAGRANGAMNVLHLVTAFAMQAGIGAIIAVWPVGTDGHPPVYAYTAAFSVVLAVQGAALAWFASLPTVRHKPRLRLAWSPPAAVQTAGIGDWALSAHWPLAARAQLRRDERAEVRRSLQVALLLLGVFAVGISVLAVTHRDAEIVAFNSP